MAKTNSEKEIEAFFEQKQWDFLYLDNKYPNVKTPDYLVTIDSEVKTCQIYIEIKEISNKRKTDEFVNKLKKTMQGSRVFTLSKERVFGSIDKQFNDSLRKIQVFSATEYYTNIPYLVVISNINISQ